MKNFFQKFNEEIDKLLKNIDCDDNSQEKKNLEEEKFTNNISDLDSYLFETPADRLVFNQAKKIASGKL